jgi:hypothetical protein
LIVCLGGCAFAVKHPPATAAIAGGTIAFVTCEVGTDIGDHEACGVITAATAAALGLITWAAIAIGGKGDTVLQNGGATDEDERPVPTDPTLDQPAPAPPPDPAPNPPAR